MKIASRPTTIARTPSPSAKAARMIARPRTWPAASGFRPIAVADSPARMPMPMPGPITPSAARPAPMCSIREIPPRLSSCLGCLVARLQRCRLRSLGGGEHVLRDVPLLLVMALNGQDDEDEREDAEDEGLDRVEHELQAEQGDGDERDRQRGDDPEGDLATIDVAEESERQRDRLDELEHQLDQAHEHRADALPELVQREELAEIAAHAQLPEAEELEDREADEGHPDGDVHVARWRAQLLDLADGRHEADPVVEDDEQECAQEDGQVRAA